MEYLLGELVGDLLAGLFFSRKSRRTTARHKVLHALRLSRRRHLTQESQDYAQRWLAIGSRHIDLFRLHRHQGRIQAALKRIQPVATGRAGDPA
jgi:hypothetical protein